MAVKHNKSGETVRASLVSSKCSDFDCIVVHISDVPHLGIHVKWTLPHLDFTQLHVLWQQALPS